MTRKNPSTDLERIDRTILNSLAALFAEPDFDNDGGEVRFLDRDDRCVWLGLFRPAKRATRLATRATEIEAKQSVRKGSVKAER